MNRQFSRSTGVRATWILKALEDKIAQQAVIEVLNAIYEVDFLGFSYGLRPGCCLHHTLDALAVGIERKKVSWVLDADIREFFTSLDHRWLARFLEHRIADQRGLRLVGKWLSAGVIENGTWSQTLEGYRVRRCWRTSTSTTSSTYVPGGGDAVTRTVT